MPNLVVYPSDKIEFVLGPQMTLGTEWFDVNLVNRGRTFGEQCPINPPPLSDANGLNNFVLLHYYDLAMCLYIAYYKTGDPIFQFYARKCADSWWKHPGWIGSGTIRLFPDSATPPPRHAGIGGLILRAMDGRPEMWDWINAYTRAAFNTWLKLRINDSSLYYGLREGGFSLHYAIWLAKCLPDTFPLQAGGTATNGATLRANYLTDCENQVLNYFDRLQQVDGSYRWNDPDFIAPDGGLLVGVTQPFMVGLLTGALEDVYRLTTNNAVKASIVDQITTACEHLYNDGPYRNGEPTTLSGVNWRSFWYFYHGGTTVNPTKYVNGGGSYVNADITSQGTWVISNERQATSTLFESYGFAYNLTGDPTYLTMGQELYDSAFVGTDGFRNFADADAKGFNQNYRMGGRYLVYRQTPTPTPTPPTVTGVNPTSGSTAGGTSITISGQNFRSGATVTLGGTSMSNPTVSATSIIGLTPPHAAGAVNVVVTNTDNTVGTLASGFTYIQPPPPPPPPPPTRTLSVTSVDPNSGITIVVSPQDNNSQSTGVTSFTRTYNDKVLVSLIAPATANNGNIFQKWQRNGVDWATSTSASVNMDASHTMTAVYTAAPPPPPPPTAALVIGSSNPDFGVTISVTPTDVNGQGNGATPFSRTYVQGTSIAVAAPSTVSGNTFKKWQKDGVDWVTTPNASLTLSTGTALTVVYEAVPAPPPQVPPTIEGVSPNSGLLSGGIPVTITGSNFQLGLTVTFDGVLATGVIVVSSSSIICTNPSRATPKKVNVVVTNPDGRSATKVKGFDYKKAPAGKNSNAGVSPNAGLVIL